MSGYSISPEPENSFGNSSALYFRSPVEFHCFFPPANFASFLVDCLDMLPLFCVGVRLPRYMIGSHTVAQTAATKKLSWAQLQVLNVCSESCGQKCRWQLQLRHVTEVIMLNHVIKRQKGYLLLVDGYHNTWKHQLWWTGCQPCRRCFAGSHPGPVIIFAKKKANLVIDSFKFEQTCLYKTYE